MKTLKNALLILTICITSIGCTSEKKSTPIIDLQNITQNKLVNLSEMLYDINIVRLDTSKDLMLSENADFLVNERYIVAIDQEKILQFSGEGEFIRVLAKAGRGPDEFIRAEVYDIDDKNDILYLNHRGDSKHIMAYNLKNGALIKKFPSGIDNLLKQMIVVDDSTLVINANMNKEYNLFYLSTAGELINGIAPPEENGIGLMTTIGKVSDNYYYMPKEYDTLYAFDNLALEPCCFFDVDDRFTLDNNETGNFIFLPSIAPKFIIVNKVHAKIKLNDDGETFTMWGDESTLFWIDRADYSVSRITGFHNDYFGIDETFDPWEDYLIVDNDLAYIKYSSFELKQSIEEALDSENLDHEVKQRISSLNEKIDENANPILIIGKLRSR
jgi:hypothetical protein